MREPEHVSIYVTSPTAEAAKRLARGLLEEGLIACANVFPVESLYTWEGAVQEEAEAAMFMKTRRDRVEAVVARVRERHEYDVPCAVSFPLAGGSAEYLAWVSEATRP